MLHESIISFSSESLSSLWILNTGSPMWWSLHAFLLPFMCHLSRVQRNPRKVWRLELFWPEPGGSYSPSYSDNGIGFHIISSSVTIPSFTLFYTVRFVLLLVCMGYFFPYLIFHLFLSHFLAIYNSEEHCISYHIARFCVHQSISLCRIVLAIFCMPVSFYGL